MSDLSGAIAAPLSTTQRPFPAILLGGLIVGALDLIYAILVYSPQKPIRIPQTIASGVLGMKSYSGGAQTAGLGVVLHFLIALGTATVYYLAGRRFEIWVHLAVVFVVINAPLLVRFVLLFFYRVLAVRGGLR